VSQSVKTLAAGNGWRAVSVRCTAGPQDRAFAETHDSVCVALVTHGTFRYRTSQGTAVMAPGSLLLGNVGACFECGHEHAWGDHCLSFQFAPDHWLRLTEEAGGAERFSGPKVPPVPGLEALRAEVEAACEEDDAEAFGEIAIRVADAALRAPIEKPLPGLTSRDHKRVADALKLIEAEATRPIALAELAGATATSDYHFLRIFRAVAGMTPHQYVLHTRMHRAALRLLSSDDPVSDIAFDAGFGDLSTFNRRFRRVMGEAPGSYRRRGGRFPAGRS
jgi:AraC family transcriptional regulator